MMQLESTHPEAHAHLVSVEFPVQRNHSNSFSQVPVDQTIEQSLNRDSKARRSTVHLKTAVCRWVITKHDRAGAMQKCKGMAGLGTATEWHHKEARQPCVGWDEVDLNTMQGWVNPFILQQSCSICHLKLPHLLIFPKICCSRFPCHNKAPETVTSMQGQAMRYLE